MRVVGHVTSVHVPSLMSTGLSVCRFFATNSINTHHGTPTVVDGQVVFPTHSEAAYPTALCDRISSLVKHEMLKQGAIEVTDLVYHLQIKGKSLHRVVWGALP